MIASSPIFSTTVLPTIPEETDSLVTAHLCVKGDMGSTSSKSSSEVTVTGPVCTARPTVPPLTVATVEKRLQEAVEDFTLTLEMSFIEDGDEIPSILYLKLLRSMLTACGNVTLLEAPKAWFDVVHEMSFPEMWCVIFRD